MERVRDGFPDIFLALLPQFYCSKCTFPAGYLSVFLHDLMCGRPIPEEPPSHSIINTAGRPFTGLSLCNLSLVMEDFYLADFTVSRLIEVVIHYINTVAPSIDVILSCWWQRLVIGLLSSALITAVDIFRACHPLQGQSIIDCFHIVKLNKANCNFLFCKVFFFLLVIAQSDFISDFISHFCDFLTVQLSRLFHNCNFLTI